MGYPRGTRDSLIVGGQALSTDNVTLINTSGAPGLVALNNVSAVLPPNWDMVIYNFTIDLRHDRGSPVGELQDWVCNVYKNKSGTLTATSQFLNFSNLAYAANDQLVEFNEPIYVARGETWHYTLSGSDPVDKWILAASFGVEYL